MSAFLADTQIVLWAAGDARKLSAPVAQAIEDPDNDVFVSAVSIAEMVIKQSIGKLSLPVPADELCRQLDFDVLALTGPHSQRMSTLPLLHRDPFDRLLIAQSLEDGLTLITSDEAIWQYAGVSLLKNE